ncbi:hypothetical protein QFC19_002615 [Naganishia cerealis]|uniref:Uncharacterized protein n=1 Tax=Naganishia cerealis TaxID=610337 RepID=A0ACC2WAQ6_9TREE|nr:hypothetical protein QFC19_002615 [Naganishia cerealis]
MARTPNADKLNASLRTSTRKRKATTTIIVSDGEGGSDYQEVLEVESSDYQEDSEPESVPPRRKPRDSGTIRTARAVPTKKAKKSPINASKEVDIEEATNDWRPHARSYHNAERIVALRNDLLEWFEVVREKRAMPWRKIYDDDLALEEKGQRAYELTYQYDRAVSEVMLQQTQVTTVIPYWRRWLLKWPTIADLAKADVEVSARSLLSLPAQFSKLNTLQEVNSAWKGLGYYRRARSLLAGAQKVMGDAKYQGLYMGSVSYKGTFLNVCLRSGRLPDDPVILEKEIDGIGRYTAGAICSMAYGIQAPIVDGNIHRLFCRLLALYAPATLPALIKKLWATAQELVNSLGNDDTWAGDLNQALMELGSQICKPSNPDCGNCPLRSGCNAYSELSEAPNLPTPESAACDICVSPPDMTSVQMPAVTIYPMKKVSKAPKEQSTAVCVIEWRGNDEETKDLRWLFVKRPQKGLLAGLFEPPSAIVDCDSSPKRRFELVSTEAMKLFSKPQEILSAIEMARSTKQQGFVQDYVHVFSHIRMTYHVHRLQLSSPDLPQLSPATTDTAWFSMEEIVSENVTTGSKNILKELYDPPQLRDGTKKARKAAKAYAGQKVVKVVKMPGTQQVVRLGHLA